jgi:hypothetical protein
VWLDVVPCTDPASLFTSTSLPLSPPDVTDANPNFGLTVEFSDSQGFTDIIAPIQSFTLVTESNTAPGTNVTVSPTATLPDGGSGQVSLLFESVQSGGTTTVTASPTPASGATTSPPEFKVGQPPVYYDVNTTATFAGGITICFSWQEGQFHNENAVLLFHHEGGAWHDITSTRDMTANTVCGQTSSLSPFALFEPSYTFTGFFSPVDNSPTRNVVKAGSAIPVRFSLGGDRGLSIFDSGYPVAQQVQCSTNAPLDTIEETVTAGASSLSYDATTRGYTYVWKTNKAWVNSCRRLIVLFRDGSSKFADFSFSK